MKPLLAVFMVGAFIVSIGGTSAFAKGPFGSINVGN
jgi:hypothetical protein